MWKRGNADLFNILFSACTLSVIQMTIILQSMAGSTARLRTNLLGRVKGKRLVV